MIPAWFKATRMVWPLSIFYGLCIVAMLVAGNVWDLSIYTVVLVGLGGVGWWTLFEYIVHRFINHGRDLPGFLNWDDHSYHHREPLDQREFVYRIALSLCFFIFFGALTWLIWPDWGLGMVFHSGFTAGYVAYEWVHLFAHLDDTHMTSWMRRLSRTHHSHHFSHSGRDFGFITSLWDRLLGTKSH